MSRAQSLWLSRLGTQPRGMRLSHVPTEAGAVDPGTTSETVCSGPVFSAGLHLGVTWRPG